MKKNEIKNSADMFLYKAIVDFNSGKYLLKSFDEDDIEIDIEKVYFDFQQSAEKLFKSLLTHHKVLVRKTHDIEELLKLCKQNNIVLIENTSKLIDLTDYAVEGRYDIICDDIEDTQIYIEVLAVFIEFTKTQLKGDNQ